MSGDFRDDPAFLRNEAKRQAALATGAMREADMLRSQLRGAVEARGKMTTALAAVLRLTYDERMPDDLADRIRSLVANAGGQ